MTLAPNIVVISDSAEARQQWTTALQAAGANVSSDWKSAADGDAFDVIVADRAFDKEATETQRAAIVRGAGRSRP